jgi:hypothetical protein
VPENLWRNAVVQIVAIDKYRHVRIIIDCRRLLSTKKAGHISQTVSSNRLLLRFCGGPYRLRQQSETFSAGELIANPLHYSQTFCK